MTLEGDSGTPINKYTHRIYLNQNKKDIEVQGQPSWKRVSMNI